MKPQLCKITQSCCSSASRAHVLQVQETPANTTCAQISRLIGEEAVCAEILPSCPVSSVPGRTAAADSSGSLECGPGAGERPGACARGTAPRPGNPRAIPMRTRARYQPAGGWRAGPDAVHGMSPPHHEEEPSHRAPGLRFTASQVPWLLVSLISLQNTHCRLCATAPAFKNAVWLWVWQWRNADEKCKSTSVPGSHRQPQRRHVRWALPAWALGSSCLCRAEGLGISSLLCFLGGRFLSFSVRTHITSNLEVNVPFYNSLFLFNTVKEWPTSWQFFKNGTLSYTGMCSELCSPGFPVPWFIKRPGNNPAFPCTKSPLNSSPEQIQENATCLQVILQPCHFANFKSYSSFPGSFFFPLTK